MAEANERYIKAAFGNAWAQALVQLAAPDEGDRVLDVACGTGPVARYAAPLVGPTGRVTGLDLSQKIRRADERIERSNSSSASNEAILKRLKQYAVHRDY